MATLSVVRLNKSGKNIFFFQPTHLDDWRLSEKVTLYGQF
jgi:hypothetical protein